MDLATLIGMVVGVGVVLASILVSSSIVPFINVPSLLIVFGGTIATTLIRYPLSSVMVALKTGVLAAFKLTLSKPADLIDEAIHCARVSREKGPMALEEITVKDTFLGKAVNLIVDGHAPEVVRSALDQERDMSLNRDEEGEKILRAIGDAAPAFGMIGTLIGLVQMLLNMGDPSTIGPAMAIAMLTTLYGALIANLFALPMADKLSTKMQYDEVNKTLVIEATSHIQNKINPRILHDILQAYLPQKERTVLE